jgi:hypothetical protein
MSLKEIINKNLNKTINRISTSIITIIVPKFQIINKKEHIVCAEFDFNCSDREESIMSIINSLKDGISGFPFRNDLQINTINNYLRKLILIKKKHYLLVKLANNPNSQYDLFDLILVKGKTNRFEVTSSMANSSPTRKSRTTSQLREHISRASPKRRSQSRSSPIKTKKPTASPKRRSQTKTSASPIKTKKIRMTSV